MSADFSSSGTIRRLEVDGLSLLLYPASELETGPANIYLRLKGPQIRAAALLGPHSGSYVQRTADGPVLSGRWGDLEYRAAFRLAALVPAWFWHVEVTNRGTKAAEVDLVYSQDIALAPYQVVRTNEYYVSQYLDLTPVQTERSGTAVAVRQNMPGAAVPWVLVGCLGQGVAWGTDAVQLGRSDADGMPTGLLADRLPSERLQHEHTLVLLQLGSTMLDPGAGVATGFYGIYQANHPSATSAQDATVAAEALRQPEAGHPAFASAEGPGPAVGTLFSPVELLPCLDLPVDQLTQLAGPGDHHAEGEPNDPFSFFTDDGTHVVLRAKERSLLRPHGHILRTGNRLVPDEASLASTAWMAGVFHSQVTQGHATLNRILSTRRGYVQPARARGLRVFMRTTAFDGNWALLDEPSAWAVSADRCRWWYRHSRGLIEVVATAPASSHQLTFQLRVLEGEPTRFLICANLAFDEDDGSDPGSAEFSSDASGVTVRPGPGTVAAARFPNGSVRLEWEPGAVDSVQADEPLFLDGHSRNLPWVTIRTQPLTDLSLDLAADLFPKARPAVETVDEPPWPDFWRGVRESVRLTGPPSSPLQGEIERLDAVLPWFAHDALIHYLSPRGLEQYSGGAWGTRDVCQGPISLLIALDQIGPLRDVLLRLLRAQNIRGDWPQWFEFLPGHLGPGQREAHGDVIFWPLLALAEYLNAGGDTAILGDRVTFVADNALTDEQPVLEHVRRALVLIAADTLSGTTLPSYGLGDWNDSLRPAHAELAERLCSTWTATLQIQALTTLAGALRRAATPQTQQEVASLAAECDRIAAESARAIQSLLFRDGILGGYGLLSDDRSFEHLVHPSDQRTGLRYGLLHISSAISGDLFTREQAARHLELVRQHLLGPDGARLFDRPPRYQGGPMEVFQRAEAATFFGREIGLMYMHAHLRYAEALARFGDAAGFFQALALANPIGIGGRVPQARPRQSTCYFTSSDAAFRDRYQAAEGYDGVMRGEAPLDGGWRVYSSGPGIYLRLITECLLGLRRRPPVFEVDPVLPPELDGLRAQVAIAGVRLETSFKVGSRGSGTRSVSLNGKRLKTQTLSNPYRAPGVAVEMGELRQHLRAEGNNLAVEVS